jgi:signal transduction histidine kinase
VSVDLAAYRILQESLTNALKHGGGQAQVSIHYGPQVVRLIVRSDVGRVGSVVPGSGAGIIGMRERAELVGGWLTAGPEDGHWSVRAELPTDSEPA